VPIAASEVMKAAWWQVPSPVTSHVRQLTRPVTFWLRQCAGKLGVSNHQIRRFIKEGVLPAKQVVFDAPWQIRAIDLQEERVKSALARKGRPCRVISEDQTSIVSDT
jgi:hypothetical protein